VPEVAAGGRVRSQRRPSFFPRRLGAWDARSGSWSLPCILECPSSPGPSTARPGASWGILGPLIHWWYRVRSIAAGGVRFSERLGAKPCTQLLDLVDGPRPTAQMDDCVAVRTYWTQVSNRIDIIPDAH